MNRRPRTRRTVAQALAAAEARSACRPVEPVLTAQDFAEAFASLPPEAPAPRPAAGAWLRELLAR